MKHLIAPCMIIALAACSGGEETAPKGTDGTGIHADAADGPQGTAAEKGFDCGTVKARPVDGPDVQGVTLGMTEKLAFEALACADPTYVVTSESLAGREHTLVKIKGESATDKIWVDLEGAVGDARVVRISRINQAKAGGEFALANLIERMSGKYGRFVKDEHTDDYYSLKTVDGQQIDAADPLFKICRYSQSYAEDTKQCGLTVNFFVTRANHNPDLVSRFDLALRNPPYTAKQEAVARGSAEAAVAARRASEVQSAAENAPSL